MLLYWLLRSVLAGPIVRMLFQPVGEGVENVPSSGPAILASNHLSAADWVFMPLLLPRRVTFLAKAEYFRGTGLKGFLQRVFFRGTGQVPIDRSSASAAEDAIQAGLRLLRAGKLLGIYPEGTRSPDGRLYRAKTGVARLTLETGAPVVPVALVYTRRRLLPGLTLSTARVCFGKPLDFSRYQPLTGDRLVERAIADEIMYEILRLSGQEYVDVYGADVKKSMAEKAAELRSRLPRRQGR